MEKYEIWALDTWGNEEEGYTVNDRSRTGITVDLDYEAMSDQDILDAIQAAGIDVGDLTLDDDNDGGFYLLDSNGREMFQVEKA